MDTRTYDVVVLGGGIGGYTAAIRAAQLGMKAAIIERDKLGGTCLHRGCIPSKALLRSAQLLAEMRNAAEFGIHAQEISVDYEQIQSRKNRIISDLHNGLQSLMKKHQIEVIAGTGRISGPSIFSPRSGAVALELPNGDAETIIPKHLIIATGSRPRLLPGLTPDGRVIMTSDEALEMDSLPHSMIILGGGVIGVEWASMLNDFGVEVTIIEAADRLIPTEDAEISQAMARSLAKRGVKVLTAAQLLTDRVQVSEHGIAVSVEVRGEVQEVKADKLLLSVGRQANVENIGLENTDVELANGVVKVNEYLQTTEHHIYAIGDVNGILPLAHAAARQGIAAVEHIAGQLSLPFRAENVARCIYTRTEAASFGLSEQTAREQGYAVKIGRFPFAALGKAHVYGDKDGFVKVIVDQNTDDILGVHMFGPGVTDLISEASLAQLLDATPWEVGQLVHPHPSLSEAVAEAMLDVDGQALNI